MSLANPAPLLGHDCLAIGLERELITIPSLVVVEKTEGISDSETWTIGHLVQEYINYTTKEKFVSGRYDNDKEEDICEGAYHKLEKQRAQNVSKTEVPLVLQKFQ